MWYFFLMMSVMVMNAEADAFPPMFPFVVSAENLSSELSVNGEIKRITKEDQIKVENDHFFNAKKENVRILGTNFSFDANFPEKEAAEYEAKRLAKLGINCVRLHHMDGHNIWEGNAKNGVTEIDSQQLDKLDYLIYQLKENGIYVNINLHVSRKFTEKEGFCEYDRRPNYDKGLDNFEPRMIALQKKYAKDLLTHKNPYTGMKYTEDPCVATIEINNENSVVSSWYWGDLDKLPKEYEDILQEKWNAWLKKKYVSTAVMRKKWKCRQIPFSQEMINGVSAPTVNPWFFQMDGVARAKIECVESKKNEKYVRITVEKNGEVHWIPQWIYRNLKYESGTSYILKFRARAGQKGQAFSLSAGMNHAPWENLGLQEYVRLSPEWKEYRFSFRARKTDEKGRISFSGMTPGVYEIADISLKSGGNIGRAASEKLENKSIKIIKRNEISHMTPEIVQDFVMFLLETEDAYWSGMYDYIKNTLHARAPVTGTQLRYGSHYAQAKMDFCDIHSYWQHPHFPGGGWSQKHWLLHNKAMVDSLGNGDVLDSLAAMRVLGKPFTVSEYNHPYPNFYAAEGFPMLCALGGFQNWNGVYLYSWSHNKEYPHQKAHGFFDACGNAVRLVHLPACHHLFVRGDVPPVPSVPLWSQTYSLSKIQEIGIFSRAENGYHRSLDEIGIQKGASWRKFTGIHLTDRKNENLRIYGKDSASAFSSPFRFCLDENGNFVQKDGFFLVDTKNTILFTGFLQKLPIKTKLGTLFLNENRLNWATVSLTRMNLENSGKGNKKKEVFLLAATGLMKNHDIKIRPYVDPSQEKVVFDTEDVRSLRNKKITCSTHWGREPVLCEGISGEFHFFQDKKLFPHVMVNYYPLDGSGKRIKKIVAENGVVRLSPEFKTLWYEVEICTSKK
ncbi:MAG: carbohydrate binding domain-containing protein [Planctomycetia bacterium]|nr:carbohydrate binding domain-containing protein [Planctomycetia bacterium]